MRARRARPIYSDELWEWPVRLGPLLVLLLLALSGCILLLRTQQHTLIYHPRPYAPEALAGLAPDGRVLTFETTAGQQSAFYLPQGWGGAMPPQLWIAFCGNGWLALDWLGLVREAPQATGAFLLVDYPGYGHSAGKATIAGTEAAAELQALARFLRVDEKQLEPRLAALGHSLGAAAALEFSTHHPVQQVIAISPFTSMREEAAFHFGRPLSHLLVGNYDNRARLRELALRRSPPRVVIFHGAEDRLIPPRMGRELADAFPGFVRFVPIAGADHVTVLTLGWTSILEKLAR